MIVLAVSRPVFQVRASAESSRKCRTDLKPKDVKMAIQHAQNICWGHEDTAACRIAWDQVEEMSTALARQMERKLLLKNVAEVLCEEDPLACREYDV
jgi:hypothetical protein